MGDIKPTSRSKLRRIPQRGCYDREVVNAIIDEALICHVAIAHDGLPRVIPMFHARIDATLYLHGSAASHLLRALGAGAGTCVAFTLLDGLVLARSAFHHSLNYRSVVLFGRARDVADPDERLEALRALTERAAPGRWLETRQPSPQELKATALAAVPIDEASAKIRSGPPIDDAADLHLGYWAGEVPLRTITLPAVPAPDLAAGMELPGSVMALLAGRT